MIFFFLDGTPHLRRNVAWTNQLCEGMTSHHLRTWASRTKTSSSDPRTQRENAFSSSVVAPLSIPYWWITELVSRSNSASLFVCYFLVFLSSSNDVKMLDAYTLDPQLWRSCRLQRLRQVGVLVAGWIHSFPILFYLLTKIPTHACLIQLLDYEKLAFWSKKEKKSISVHSHFVWE